MRVSSDSLMRDGGTGGELLEAAQLGRHLRGDAVNFLLQRRSAVEARVHDVVRDL